MANLAKKKKQKLNTRFLSIVGCVVLVILLGFMGRGYLYRAVPQLHWMLRGSPQQHADKGKALFDQGKYAEAADEYKLAAGLKGTPDAPVLTALGECYSHLILKDPENRLLAMKYWESALTVDPNYLPALLHMLEISEGTAEIARGPAAVQWWDAVHEKAQRVVAVDPQNLRAKISMYRAVIMKSFSGIETSTADTDDAINGLIAVSQQKPFYADSILYAAQAKINRAGALIKMQNRVDASTLLDDTMKLVEDALAAHPDDAAMHYRAGFLLGWLGSIDRSPGQAPKYTDRVRHELDQAVALVKPDEEDYVEIKLSVAKIIDSLGEHEAAQKMYRALLTERPEEIQVRIALAEALDHSDNTRAEAIELLEKAPPLEQSKASGAKAITMQLYESTLDFDLLTAKLDQLAIMKDQTSQWYQSLLAEIEADYAKFASTMGAADSPPGLQARGRIQLAKGQYIDAVQTLKRAFELMPKSANTNSADMEQRRRVMLLLAQAYMYTEQTGQARALLTDVLGDFPGLVPARIMLVQLLLNEGNVADAQRHLDFLVQNDPKSASNSVIIRLQMHALDVEKDKDKLAGLYDKLPETTPPEMLDKAAMAIYCKRLPDAAKLYESVHAADPSNLTVQVNLARIYSDMGDKAHAQPLINDAVAKNPDRADLKLLQTRIAGGNVQEERNSLAENISDPLSRELTQHTLALQQNKPDEARQHFLNAVKINADDPRVIELQFNYALKDHQWDKAATFLGPLAKLNRDKADGMLFRVRYDMARGALDSAESQANDLKKKMPEFSQSWLVLAQVQQAQHKYTEARENFASALEKQPDNFDALQGLIATDYALDHPNSARANIDKGLRMFPDNALLKEMDLDYELKYGNPENAIGPRQQMLDKAIAAKAPGESAAWLALGNTYLAVAKSKKDAAAARPFYEKARDTFKDAAAKWPDELSFTDSFAEACLQLHDTASGEKAILALRDQPSWKAKPEPTLMLANYYARADKPLEDQEKVLRDFLSTAPTTPVVQIQLSGVLAKNGKLDDAMKILDANADDPLIRRQRIELQIAANHLPEAEKEIQTALASTTDPSDVLLDRQAFVYMRSGRATQALQILDKVLARSPGDIEALSYRATIYVAAHRNLDAAVRDLQIVKQVPANALNARMLLAEAYHDSGDDERATSELEDTVKLFPAEKAPKLRLIDFYTRATPPRWSPVEKVLSDARSQPALAKDTDLMQAEATMWLKRNDSAKATSIIQQAMKLAPSDTRLFQTYCDILLQSKQAASYRQILSITDPLVKSKKAEWWAYVYRGRAQKALGEKQIALDEFSAGLDKAFADKNDGAVAVIVNAIADEIGVPSAENRILPMAEKGDNRWRLMMAQLAQADNDVPGALTWVQKVMDDPAAAPDLVDVARNTAATFYLRMDPPDIHKAVDLYRKLLERDPNNVVALNNLACAMILPGSGYTAKDALEYSEKAFKVIEQAGAVDPYIYDTQGFVLVLAGRVTEGINLLQQSIDKQPIPEACYHLGEAYLALPTAQPENAQEALKQAIALLDAASRDNKPLDAELKGKIDKAMSRAQALPTSRPTS